MKILITRPRGQADSLVEKLNRAGMEAICFPVIEVHPILNNVPLQKALSRLSCYEWIVFTSTNGVDAVFNEIGKMNLNDVLTRVKVAAIGPKTAETLVEHNVTPAFVPEEYVAEAIMPGLGELRDRWVLLPRADIARKALSRAIGRADGIAHEIPVYRTLPAEPDRRGLQALRLGVDVVTLTSSSTAQNFASIVRAAGLDPAHLPGNPVFACIGPITEQTAREEGLPNRLVADEYTTKGLVRAIEALGER